LKAKKDDTKIPEPPKKKVTVEGRDYTCETPTYISYLRAYLIPATDELSKGYNYVQGKLDIDPNICKKRLVEVSQKKAELKAVYQLVQRMLKTKNVSATSSDYKKYRAWRDENATLYNLSDPSQISIPDDLTLNVEIILAQVQSARYEKTNIAKECQQRGIPLPKEYIGFFPAFQHLLKLVWACYDISFQSLALTTITTLVTTLINILFPAVLSTIELIILAIVFFKNVYKLYKSGTDKMKKSKYVGKMLGNIVHALLIGFNLPHTSALTSAFKLIKTIMNEVRESKKPLPVDPEEQFLPAEVTWEDIPDEDEGEDITITWEDEDGTPSYTSTGKVYAPGKLPKHKKK